MKNQDQECCPEFSKEKWDKKTITWNEKPFIKESIPTFFHIPFPPMIGKKIMKMHKLIDESNAGIQNKEDILVLFRDPSAFKSEIYFSVSGKVNNANNTQISGTFITGVFDGPYNSIPKYIEEMDEYVKGQGQIAKEYYIHYAYCPKCAKEYGHNYMILFARI